MPVTYLSNRHRHNTHRYSGDASPSTFCLTRLQFYWLLIYLTSACPGTSWGDVSGRTRCQPAVRLVEELPYQASSTMFRMEGQRPGFLFSSPCPKRPKASGGLLMDAPVRSSTMATATDGAAGSCSLCHTG
jgi:hypothetical protein